ncbi:MAG: two-component system, unclassified family, response regulator [Candidatus Methanomarinus sp.]|nr:MAG: two-component system, unclassified family, response regulator [ANME-2 cluster archaeon]
MIMKKARILIVEDEAIVAEDLENLIIDFGYEMVGSVVGADDAIQQAIEHRPDLILMDIMLKGNKNGIDAANEIKDMLKIPIIFLTAYSDLKLIEEAKNTEPYAFIVKPFQDKQVIASIELALRLLRR